MMAPRLVEMHRVLKPTGSIYLHCDPTASHYLKILMDGVFDGRNFQNEIIWGYKTQGASKKRFARKHDTVLFYSKSEKWKFNTQYEKSFMMHKYGFRGSDFKIDPETGQQYNIVIAKDIWNIPALQSATAEKLGYATQKPEALLERIIKASSDEGDVVMDPFCGCGTTISVAERLKRKWIGIDITCLATALIKNRLRDTFGDKCKYNVIGEPISLTDAENLAETNPFHFQYWAAGLVGGRPIEQKKGPDKGIDGRIYFHDEIKGGSTKQIILQVKGGKVSAPQLRDLLGVVERENAAIGVFISLQKPTQAMKKEVASAGFYTSPGWNTKHPRLQILTIEELLNGKRIDYPAPMSTSRTFKKAPQAKTNEHEQQDLFN
jgi:site-specific DNA-methyltransferase (adenine-specific)